MILDITLRDALVQELLRCLRQAEPTSQVALRSSLAEGRADAYSDIDLWWEVPDSSFSSLDRRLPELLSGIRPIEGLFSEPDFQKSDRRRMYFVHFEGVPLFWRVDMEVFAASLRGDRTYDLNNPAARGEDWSLAHSALINVVTMIKILLRGRAEQVGLLIRHEFQRVGLPFPDGEIGVQIVTLVEGIR